MNNNTITSANSILTLVVPGLFPTPVQIHGFSTDKMFDTEAVEITETKTGVDGRLSGGWVFNPTNMTIALQADSPSISFFADLMQASDTAREVYVMSGSIIMPAIGKSFVLTRGFIVSGQKMPSAQKVLQPIEYKTVWESFSPALI